MTKNTTTHDTPFPTTPAASQTGVADEPTLYRDDPKARFAPFDNLADAIRSDVAPIGGVILPTPPRDGTSEYPFNDIDLNPYEDE